MQYVKKIRNYVNNFRYLFCIELFKTLLVSGIITYKKCYFLPVANNKNTPPAFLKNKVEVKNTDTLKRILLIRLVVILLALSATSARAQIVQFSQFYSSPLFLAPSYAGTVKASRLSLNYRNQWPEAGTFNTYALSYDQNMYKINSGIGIMAMRDEAGDGCLARTDVGVSYSWYTQMVRKWYFRPGISVKYCKRSIDFEKLVFSDMIDEKGNISRVTTEDPPLSSKPYLDMSASTLFYSEKYWGGVTVDHLLKPKTSLYDDPDYQDNMVMSVFGGAKVYVGKGPTGRGRKNVEDLQSVTFSMLYQWSKVSDQLDCGAYWNKNPFTLGMWLRGIPLASGDSFGNLDAIIFLVGYKIFSLHIGYSYDFSIGELLSVSGGAHEISVMYEFEPKAKAKKRHSVISCPKL